MPRRLVSTLTRVLLAVATLAATAVAQAVPYDVVYVRQPRFGDSANTTWPEVFHPARLDPGADLMLLHANGSEEVLVPGQCQRGAIRLPGQHAAGQDFDAVLLGDCTASWAPPSAPTVRLATGD